MSDVILISPYSQIEAIGLRQLSACLKAAGFSTRMIFLPDLEEMMVGADYSRRLPTEVISQIAGLCDGALLVGISVMTPSFLLARDLTLALKGSVRAPIMWGGVHATVRPAECLAYADLVCVGEGERTVVELARRMSRGEPYHDVPNLAYRGSDGHLTANPLYPLERDLDLLPFPDYDFGEHSVLHRGQLVAFSQELMVFYLTDLGSWARGPVYGVWAARGCPYHCSYCANDAMVRLYPDWCQLRRRSPANIIAEIRAIRARLPRICAITIRDDTFLANPDSYIEEFSRLYKEQVGLPFRAYTTAQTASRVKLQLLTQAGLTYCIMGIQTGSPRTQALYRRTADNAQMLRAARLIHDFRHYIPRPMYDVITDNPYEDEADRYETLRLIHELPAPYRLSLFALTFYPGTGLYEQAKRDGAIRDETNEIYLRNFQMVRPSFHNFALYCHSLNLPRLLLHLISRRQLYFLCSRPPIDQLFGKLFEHMMRMRLRSNRNLYANRAHDMLSSRSVTPYASAQSL